MFSVKGSTFTGYDGDGVIAEAGEGYVNRPGGVDGAVIENNTFDLGVASDTLTGTTQPIVIDADQGSTTTSVLISGNSVTTNGIGAEAIALTTASDPSSPGQITTVTIKNNSLTATGPERSTLPSPVFRARALKEQSVTSASRETTYSVVVRALTSTVRLLHR